MTNLEQLCKACRGAPCLLDSRGTPTAWPTASVARRQIGQDQGRSGRAGTEMWAQAESRVREECARAELVVVAQMAGSSERARRGHSRALTIGGGGGLMGEAPVALRQSGSRLPSGPGWHMGLRVSDGSDWQVGPEQRNKF
jgi:hypothetical protein